VRLIVEEWGHIASLVTLRWLDLDYICAEVCQ